MNLPPTASGSQSLLVGDELLAFEHNRRAVEQALRDVGLRFVTWAPALLPGLFVVKLIDGTTADAALTRLESKHPDIRAVVAHHLVVDAQAHAGMCPAAAPTPVSPGTAIKWLKGPVLIKAAKAPESGPLLAVIDSGYDPEVGAQHSHMAGITGELERPPARATTAGRTPSTAHS